MPMNEAKRDLKDVNIQLVMTTTMSSGQNRITKLEDRWGISSQGCKKGRTETKNIMLKRTYTIPNWIKNTTFMIYIHSLPSFIATTLNLKGVIII